MLSFYCNCKKQRFSLYCDSKHDTNMALFGKLAWKLNIIVCSNPPVFGCCTLEVPSQSSSPIKFRIKFFLLFYLKDGVSMPLGIAVGNWDSAILVPWRRISETDLWPIKNADFEVFLHPIFGGDAGCNLNIYQSPLRSTRFIAFWFQRHTGIQSSLFFRRWSSHPSGGTKLNNWNLSDDFRSSDGLGF